MILNTKKITRKSRYWKEISSLALEAFPTEKHLEPDELVDIAKKITSTSGHY